MRVKFDDNFIVDYGGTITGIKLIQEDTKWYIIVDPMSSPLARFKFHKFFVGDDGDTGFNDERVEKIAENEINFAFLNGFLDLSDYEEVT